MGELVVLFVLMGIALGITLALALTERDRIQREHYDNTSIDDLMDE